MRNIKFFLIVLGSLALKDSVIAQTKKQSAAKITFTANLPDSLKSVVKETVKLFSFKYGPIRSLIVGDDTISEANHRSDGSTVTTIAYSTPGATYINRRIPVTCDGLRTTMKHELFHILSPSKPTLLPVDKFFVLSDDGFEVIGYKGLSLVVWNPEKNITTQFKFVEEAAAELAAMKIEPGYTTTSPSYYSLGSFMRDIVDVGWITTDQLVHEQRTNGFLEFCSHLLKKEKFAITKDDEIFVASCFQKIWDSKENYKSVMTSIIEKRGEKGKYNIGGPK